MYERQHGGDMEVGSYAHRPILVDAGRRSRRSRRRRCRRPSCRSRRTTSTRSWRRPWSSMPELLGDERVGIRYAINGLISMTPDGHPAARRDAGGRAACGRRRPVWIKEGPGVGRRRGRVDDAASVPEIDVHEADIARFYPHQRTQPTCRRAARRASTRCTESSTRREQWESGRPRPASAPCTTGSVSSGAVFFETAGWERPHWYASNERPAGAVRRAADAARARVGGALVVADHQRRAPGHARVRAA